MIESKTILIYTINKNIKMIKKPLNRICPTCKKIIEYKSREACRKGERTNSICKSCAVKFDYIKNPNKNIGEKNGRFGKDLKDLMISKYGIEKGNLKYDEWKFNINSFKKGPENPQFGKPGHINSGMSYKGWFMSMFFRSSFELVFIYDYYKKNKKLPISAESNNFKVSIIKDNKEYNYFPDFYCPIKNCIYEIKSKTFLNTESNIIKREFAKKHFNSKGIQYVVLTENDIETFNKLGWQKIIDEFLYNLILENEVKLTEKSILKLKNRFTKGNKLKKLEILNTL